MFQTEVLNELKTHILCSVIFFFRKSCHLRDNVGKYGRAGQATDDTEAENMTFASRLTQEKIQTQSQM